MKKKHMTINSDRCMGCCACEIACKMEYQLPAGIRFIVMHEKEDLSRQKLTFSFTVCRHCENPACLSACPNQAIYQREDGIVLVREDSCIGCRRCSQACPYDVPRFSETGVMRKCSLCASRLDQGLAPACVTACPAEAITISR